MDQMSARSRWLFVMVVAGAVACAAWFGLGPGRTTVATWRVSGTTDPTSTQLPLLVNETACASGRSAEGRIKADVDYRSDAVVITIRVRPRGGDQDCPSNPDTPYLLRLDEPVGDRVLLDGGQRPPSPPMVSP